MALMLTLGVFLFLLDPLAVSSSPAPRVSVDPAEIAALTDEARKAIGVQNGPDSVATVTTIEGQLFTLFSGLNIDRERGTFRFRGAPPSRLLPDPSTRSKDGRVSPRAVLQPGSKQPLEARLGGLYSDDGRYNGFDRDYAGGGTALYLEGQLYYFYHGENIFRMEQGSKPTSRAFDGWGGLGLAVWEPRTGSFRKLGQVVGLGAPNGVSAKGNNPEACEQTAPMADEANAVFNPSDNYIYLYYSDASPTQPNRSQVSLARSSREDFLRSVKAGTPPRFLKYFEGRFSEPGVTSQGMGGRSSPILDKLGYRSPHVLWLPKNRMYLMVTVQGHQKVELRMSRDGLKWDHPVPLATARQGTSALYPYLYGPRLGDGNESDYILLFTQVTRNHDEKTGQNRISYKDGASLQQRKVRITW